MRAVLRRAAAVLMAVAVLAAAYAPAVIAEAYYDEEIHFSGDYGYRIRQDGTAELAAYSGDAPDVRIPEMLDGRWVTSIGDHAFAEAGFISVHIPLSVTQVGVNPFTNCEELLNIDVADGHPTLAAADLVLFSLPDRRLVSYPCGLQLTAYTVPAGTLEIGADAFAWCAFLENVKLCEGLERIGDSAFTMCGGLTSITIPNSVRTLGVSAFAGAGLTRVTLPAGLETLPSRVFYGCENLAALTMPETIREIGDEALGFTPVTEISIPAGVERIGVNPFVGCDELTVLNLAEDGSPFRMEGPLLIDTDARRVITCLTRTVGEARVPDGITEIGDWAFYGCSELTDIRFPDTLDRIGEGGLNACMACQRLSLPEGLTALGSLAMADCFLLETVELPGTLTQIGEGILDGCESLVSVTVEPGSAAEAYCLANGLPAQTR